MALLLRPPLHRLGPLLGQVVLRQSLQRAHQLAVHDAGRERVELARGRRHPGLFEQGQAALDVTVEDQQSRLRDASDGGGRGVAPRAHLDGSAGPLLGAWPVPAQHPLVVADHGEPGVGWRDPALIEELLGATQPATHRCHQGGVEQQVHRQAHRGAGRRCGLAGGHQSCVCALPGLDGDIEVPRAVGGVGEHRQIREADLAARIRLPEQVERCRPLTTGCGVVGTLEDAARCTIAHRGAPIYRRLPR